jgi:5'-nucleotidase
MKIYRVLCLVCVVLSLSSCGKIQDLVILHTNDTHSQIEPIRVGKGKGLGGVSRRGEYFDKVKSENKNVLIFDAGDYNQGTPYFTVFRGALEVEIMNQLGYTAVALGNHEFDNGVEELSGRLKKAKFPTVCANVDFSNTPLEGVVKPYIIIRKGGRKIGVFGLILNLDNLVSKKCREGIVVKDGFETANKVAKMLKEEKKCDLVIALTHIGYSSRNPKVLSDFRLAEHSKNIDIIIGGHSHTFLVTEKIFKNLDNKDVIVLQDGASGEYVGRLDIHFEE